MRKMYHTLFIIFSQILLSQYIFWSVYFTETCEAVEYNERNKSRLLLTTASATENEKPKYSAWVTWDSEVGDDISVYPNYG